MRPPPKANTEHRAAHKKKYVRALRTNATDVECKLWSLLRRKRLHPFRFRRQQPVGPYIADFFCAQARLIVELDGDQHGLSENRRHDAQRTEFLNARGYQVLRFPNGDVLKTPDDVLETIWRAASQRAPLPETAPAISTLPQGEGGGAADFLSGKIRKKTVPRPLKFTFRSLSQLRKFEREKTRE